MKKLYALGLLLMGSNIITSCNGQTHSNNAQNRVGGAFENSSYTYHGMPTQVSATDTSPGWNDKGTQILLTGIVYQRDGKTPAPGVLLYYYQTNTAGRYVHKPEMARSMPPNNLGQTHGYIRGWVKTGADGRYAIYTIRPGSYPTHDEPAHVHMTVKEPNDIEEYYIDDFVFDDDKLLTSAKRQRLDNRSGSGILRLVQKGSLLVGERNIILGLNIPNYPAAQESKRSSGPNVGEDVFSFIPYHAWGPDKGSRTCPVCKYGWYNGILYFVGNQPDWTEIAQWLQFLEAESIKRERYLKVYFVYGNERDYNNKSREKELEKMGQDLQLQNVALTYVPSLTDTESEIHLNKIDPSVQNTFVLYKRSRVIDRFVDLKPTEANFAQIQQRLDQSINEYFHLPKLKAD